MRNLLFIIPYSASWLNKSLFFVLNSYVLSKKKLLNFYDLAKVKKIK